jgi:hypothetical protein
VHISNTKIFNSQQHCWFFNQADLFTDGLMVLGCSKAGVGSYPLVELGSHVVSVNMVGGYINDSNASYGITTDSGASGCRFFGINLTGNHTGGINDGAGCANGGANMVQRANPSTISSSAVSWTFSNAFADTPSVSCTQSGGNQGGTFYISVLSTTGFTITQQNSSTQSYQCVISGN